MTDLVRTPVIIRNITILLSGLSLLLADNELKIKYELDITFIPQESDVVPRIEGVNHITITNQWDRPLEEIYLHNNTNGYFDPEDERSPKTTIGAVRSAHLGEVLDQDKLSMQISLDPALSPGETALIDVPFNTRLSRNPNPFLPTVGSKEDTTIYNLIFFYPVLEYFHEDGWHTANHDGKADPHSNLAEYQVTLTYPLEYQVGTSAHSLGADTLGSGQVVERYHYPRALSFSMAVSDKFERKQAVVHGIDMELYYTPGQAGNVSKLLENFEEIVPYYIDLFGPCQNDKMTVTMAYSLGENAGALATSNYIIYKNSMSGVNTLAHEFGHQWFGNAINADENYETWLNESFSEYASRRYYLRMKGQEHRPAPFFNPKLFDLWSDVREISPEDFAWLLQDFLGDRGRPPIYVKGQQINWENLDDLAAMLAEALAVYYFGSNALQMLQASLGDSVMRDIMLTYSSEYTWKTVDTETFIGVVERVAGEKVAENFHQAVTVSRRPDYKIVGVDVSRNSDGRWTTNVQTGFQGDWLLPIDIRVITVDGDTVCKHHIWVDEMKEVQFTTSGPVAKIDLAPEGKVFDYHRFNNHWPRSFQIQPVFGLPSWDTYKLYFRPKLKKDWRGNWRYGLRITGGLGVNLMPFSPSYYKNSIQLDLMYAPVLEDRNWGGQFLYRTPLGSNPLIQWEVGASYEYPRSREHMAVRFYLGNPSFYLFGGESQYTLVAASIMRTEYTESGSDDWWCRGGSIAAEATITSLHHTPENRSLVRAAFLLGYPESGQPDRPFTRFTFTTDHNLSVGDIFALRFWSEGKFIRDERTGSDLRFQLGRLPNILNEHAGVSRFRGRSDADDQWWDTMLAGGVSLGLDRHSRINAEPVAFLDLAMIGNSSGAIFEQVRDLVKSRPVYVSFGLGMESRSIVDLGLYLPLWVSHPPEGESNLKVRLMLEFALNW